MESIAILGASEHAQFSENALLLDAQDTMPGVFQEELPVVFVELAMIVSTTLRKFGDRLLKP